VLRSAAEFVDEFCYAFSQTILGRIAWELPYTVAETLSSGLLSTDQDRQVLSERQAVDCGDSSFCSDEPLEESFFPAELVRVGEQSDLEQERRNIQLSEDVATSADYHCPSSEELLLDSQLLSEQTLAGGPLADCTLTDLSLFIDLPELCLDKIISCLDSQDLAALSSASKGCLQLVNSHRSAVQVSQACLAGGFFPSLVDRFSHLRVLKIKEPVDVPTDCRFDEKAARLLASRCPDLKELHVEDCHSLAYHGILKLIERCKELTVLKVRRCLCFSPNALSGRYGTRISALKVIELVRCFFFFEDAHVHTIAVAAPALRELVLDPHSRGFTKVDAALSFLAEKCRTLEKLEITSCGITDDTVASFAACCKTLTSVSFHCEPSLTDRSLRSMAASLTALKQLQLLHCPQLTGAGLGRCQTLERLTFGTLPQLTESALVHLTSLGALSLLAFFECPSVFRRCCGEAAEVSLWPF
jgi:hypothetical protein